MADILLWLAAVALIAVGLAGTVLPVVPGTALVLIGIVLGAWIDDFTRVGWPVLTIIMLLAVASWVLDYVAGLLGAKRAGASGLALAGAAIGTIVGLFLGFVGVLFMPLAGAALGEFIARHDQFRAVRVGIATWLGIVAGLLAKVVISFMMIGIFIAALVI
jgi:uncharacterized protein YqgC (DUF456 family)